MKRSKGLNVGQWLSFGQRGVVGKGGQKACKLLPPNGNFI